MPSICNFLLLTRDDVPRPRGHEGRRVHLVRLAVQVVQLHLPTTERPRLELQLARLRKNVIVVIHVTSDKALWVFTQPLIYPYEQTCTSKGK